jgi:NitT/TauT family transport system substrate-binding protein
MLRGLLAALGVALALSPAASKAEVSEIRVGKQFGFPYFQLIVMQDKGLIEKHAKAAGLGEVKVDWVTMGGPAALNDGIISGAIDFASVGLPNLVTMWSKTKGNIDVRGISGNNLMPLLLVTRNPKIKTLKDYGPESRIAVPSVKVSAQAILLGMAAAKEFGDANYTKLDTLTVSMAHPDAFAALVSGQIDSHYSSTPFQEKELETPGIHLVLSSFDTMGGPHSVGAIVMQAKFHDGNPKTVAAIRAAYDEATEWIKANHREAAESYIRVTKEKTSPDELMAMMNKPEIQFTAVPMGVQRFATFMQRIGLIKTGPESWKDLFFAEAHGMPGN